MRVNLPRNIAFKRVRERIGRNFAWAGIRIDPKKNAGNDTNISYGDAPVRVRVLPSDEERMIALDTMQLIAREGNS